MRFSTNDASTNTRRKRLANGKYGQGPCSRKNAGNVGRRILDTVVIDGVEYSYHATKGWRAVTVRTGSLLLNVPPMRFVTTARLALRVPQKQYLRAGTRVGG